MGLTEIVSGKARQVLYAVFAFLGVGLGATQVAYMAADAGQPQWLTVAIAVFAFVGTAFGFTAAANVGVGGELPYKTTTTLADGTVIDTQYGTPEAADMGDSFRDVVAEGHQRARGESAGQAHGDYDYPPGESPMGR